MFMCLSITICEVMLRYSKIDVSVVLTWKNPQTNDIKWDNMYRYVTQLSSHNTNSMETIIEISQHRVPSNNLFTLLHNNAFDIRVPWRLGGVRWRPHWDISGHFLVSMIETQRRHFSLFRLFTMPLTSTKEVLEERHYLLFIYANHSIPCSGSLLWPYKLELLQMNLI